jgi:hypothetical protein
MGRADPRTVISELLSVRQLVAPLAETVNLQGIVSENWTAAALLAW